MKTRKIYVKGNEVTVYKKGDNKDFNCTFKDAMIRFICKDTKKK
jgi:glutaredoxin-related protein